MCYRIVWSTIRIIICHISHKCFDIMKFDKDGKLIAQVISKKIKLKEKEELLLEKDEFHTYETWCLIKLEELGRVSKKQWAKEMGVNYSFMLDPLIKKNIDKINVISISKTQVYYEIKEGIKIR